MENETNTFAQADEAAQAFTKLGERNIQVTGQWAQWQGSMLDDALTLGKSCADERAQAGREDPLRLLEDH